MPVKPALTDPICPLGKFRIKQFDDVSAVRQPLSSASSSAVIVALSGPARRNPTPKFGAEEIGRLAREASPGGEAEYVLTNVR